MLREASDIGRLEEEEVLERAAAEQIHREASRARTSIGGDGHEYHSTGRGGLANVTSKPTPPPEAIPPHVHPEHEFVSTGRGGAGNIRDRSQSRTRDSPQRQGHGHGLGKLLDKVTGHHEHERGLNESGVPPLPTGEARFSLDQK